MRIGRLILGVMLAVSIVLPSYITPQNAEAATTFLVTKNWAQGYLNADINAAVTTIVLQSGNGANFPTTFPFHIVIEQEIIKVTNRVTDTLTVTRAQEGTTAAAHSSGGWVRLNITAGYISELQAAINTLETSPVVSGAMSVGGVLTSTAADQNIQSTGVNNMLCFEIKLGTTINTETSFRYGRNTNSGSGTLYSRWCKGDGTATYNMILDHKLGNLTLAGDAILQGGDLDMGVSDTTQGILDLYGNSTTGGGAIQVYNSATTEDDVYNSYILEANGLAFELGPNTNTNAFQFGGDGTLVTESGVTATGVLRSSTWTAFANNTTTQSVAAGNHFDTGAAWTAGNNITAFSNGADGQEIIVLGNDADCVIVDGANLTMNGNWTATPGCTLSLVYRASVTTWYETGRSPN